jgi:integral membrane protein (TIGR01906 family)
MDYLKRIVQWVLVILVPIILILLSVRFLLTPVFINLEYRMPNFPEDGYGFTTQERLQWSDVALEYLLNNAGIEFLGDLSFEDGSELYNERELRHMLDVKIVVKAALRVLWASFIVVALVGVWARYGDWWYDYRRALGRGGWLTVGLIVAVIAAIAINFNTFFVAFHRIFFQGDTWLFRFSDTLIRLFPVRFWQDAFISVGVIALIGGLLLGLFAGRSRQAAE